MLFDLLLTLNECLIVTGFVAAACERTVVPASNGYANLTNGIFNGHKAHNENNGFKSPNGSLNNGVYTNGNGNRVHVDGNC